MIARSLPLAEERHDPPDDGDTDGVGDGEYQDGGEHPGGETIAAGGDVEGRAADQQHGENEDVQID